jgi:hypothetical protein
MRELSTVEMTTIAGAGKSCHNPCHDPCAPRPKGNNGWGNGAEGINAGSFSGGTAGSKSDESWTIGDGPKPRKFDFR